jgi:hypothetical protein
VRVFPQPKRHVIAVDGAFDVVPKERKLFVECLKMVDGTDKALQRVSAPATGLMIAGILSAVADTFVAVGGLLDRKLFGLGQAEGLVGVVGVLLSGIVIVGAVRMKALKSYRWAITASVCALITICYPCGIVSLAMGIWSLGVLFDPNV